MRVFILAVLLTFMGSSTIYASDRMQSRTIKTVSCNKNNICTFTTKSDELHKTSIKFTLKADKNNTITKFKSYRGKDVVLGFTGNVNNPKVKWIMLADND